MTSEFIKILFFGLMLFFCYTDCRKFLIPNVVVLPAIVLTCALTGNWIPALIMLGIGALFFKQEMLGGGDVKLMMLLGGFFGFNAFFAFGLSRIIIYLYRIVKRETRALPYAPFLFISGVPLLWIR